MKRHRAFMAFLAACAVIAGFSQLWTRPAAGRCALDGVRIDAVYAVDLRWGEKTLSFCSVRDAVRFIEQDRPPDSITARDEVTGQPLDVRRAYFVESEVMTVRSAANNVHVFAHWADAAKHVEAYAGRQVPNPFRSWLDTRDHP